MESDYDPFGQEWYAPIALKKMGDPGANFRIYCVGWLECKGVPFDKWDVLEVTGAEFRAAKSGPRKGRLVVEVPGTRRTVHIHSSERLTNGD